MQETQWWIYIVRCGDDSLYTGIATDVSRRLSEHQAGAPKGAKYLRGRGPLELLWLKKIGNRSEATKEELRVKKLSREQKMKLVISTP